MCTYTFMDTVRSFEGILHIFEYVHVVHKHAPVAYGLCSGPEWWSHNGMYICTLMVRKPHSWLQPTSARWAGMVYIHTWDPPTPSPLDRPHSEVLILPECTTWTTGLCIIFERLLFPHWESVSLLDKVFFFQFTTG